MQLPDLADAKFAPEDLSKLAQKQLESIVDDYVKLQHPSQRRRAYLQEAFLDARDAVFDQEFRFACFQNDAGLDMTIQEMIALSLDDDRPQIEPLQQYCIKQARDFWENRTMNTLAIPDTVSFDGHVYSVLHSTESPYLDLDLQEIHLDRHDTTTNQEVFVRLCFQIICHHQETKIAAKHLDELGRALFRLLKMNECFSPPHVPPVLPQAV